MPGYIINLSSTEALKIYIQHGVYSTRLNVPKNGYWQTPHEGTFADYATMKPVDNIYFFINRKIYGIGELVEVEGDCRFLNFPSANKPYRYNYSDIKDQLLWDEGEHSISQRWLCTFKPSPYFFGDGVDMDDVLASNPPRFRMLRAFWKLSFVKVDDDENQALKDYILRNNVDSIFRTGDNILHSDWQEFHDRLRGRVGDSYYFNASDLLKHCATGDYLRHEMAIEAGILYQMSEREENAVEVFGEWDYLSHQVIASPFKPVDYMDKMDIFGYSYITGFRPTKLDYLVIEIKKDAANIRDIEQLMKYVDWVKDEYTFGDFSMINAFLVAYDFDEEAKRGLDSVSERRYLLGRRPVRSGIWNNLSLVLYRYQDRALHFELVK